MNPHEFLRLNAATAFSADRFCVSFDGGDPDDPFSIILSYDGRFPQPWTRTDAPRRIVGIAPVSGGEEDGIYAAVSDEGDVYTISGTDVAYEKITGAGLYSDDALGAGQLNGALMAADTLWAFGFGGQVYRRQPDGWRKVEIDDKDAARFSITFGRFEDAGAGWFCGSSPPPLLREGYTEESDLLAQIAATDDFETYNRLMDELGRKMRGESAGAAEPLLLHYADGSLKRVTVDSGAAQVLNGIFIDSPNQVWVVGGEGSILHGSIEAGFKRVTYAGEVNENFVAIDRFQNDFIIASDFGLFRFDGHILTRLRPRLPSFDINKNVPTPLCIQAVDGILMYFDRKHGVSRWDGNHWDWVDIPNELLERDFQGLR